MLRYLGDGPVLDSEVMLVVCGLTKANKHGYAQIILDGYDWYALVIRYPGHEQVLYMEQSLYDGKRLLTFNQLVRPERS